MEETKRVEETKKGGGAERGCNNGKRWRSGERVKERGEGGWRRGERMEERIERMEEWREGGVDRGCNRSGEGVGGAEREWRRGVRAEERIERVGDEERGWRRGERGWKRGERVGSGEGVGERREGGGTTRWHKQGHIRQRHTLSHCCKEMVLLRIILY